MIGRGLYAVIQLDTMPLQMQAFDLSQNCEVPSDHLHKNTIPNQENSDRFEDPIKRSHSKIARSFVQISLSAHYPASSRKLFVPRAIRIKRYALNSGLPKMGGVKNIYRWPLTRSFNKFSLNQYHQILAEVFSTLPKADIIQVNKFINHSG